MEKIISARMAQTIIRNNFRIISKFTPKDFEIMAGIPVEYSPELVSKITNNSGEFKEGFLMQLNYNWLQEISDKKYDGYKTDSRFSGMKDSNFPMFYTYKELEQTVKSGWKKGREIASKINLQIKNDVITDYYIGDEFNDLFDVGQYVSGSPDMYINESTLDVEKQAVDVVMDITYPFHISKREITLRALMVFAICENVNKKDIPLNIRTEVIVSYASRISNLYLDDKQILERINDVLLKYKITDKKGLEIFKSLMCIPVLFSSIVKSDTGMLNLDDVLVAFSADHLRRVFFNIADLIFYDKKYRGMYRECFDRVGNYGVCLSRETEIKENVLHVSRSVSTFDIAKNAEKVGVLDLESKAELNGKIEEIRKACEDL